MMDLNKKIYKQEDVIKKMAELQEQLKIVTTLGLTKEKEKYIKELMVLEQRLGSAVQ